MKKLLLLIGAVTMLFSCNNEGSDVSETRALKIHEGQFAFCGASAAVPTGKKIIVQGVEYDEGCAICPVLTGPSLASDVMYGTSGTYGKFSTLENFQTPDGTNNTVWSYFWYYDTSAYIPQFNPETKTWEMMHPVNRKFTIDMSDPSTSESNMFAMPGVIFDTTETGIILAKVYGPLNESAIPLRKSIPVKNGQTAITAAKEGSPYPVGQPIPNKN
jgi:hypothetical protein